MTFSTIISSPVPMGIPQLPPELILVILEHAYYTPAGSPDHAFLATCSLVCTSWSMQARSLLFYKSTKLKSHAIASFRAALMLSAVRGKPMGNTVRSLDISVGGSLPGACQPQAFAQLLQACPRLYELSLSTRGFHDFDQFALAKLKGAGQCIRALNIQDCGVQSPVLFQLLGIWHRIQFLKIGTEIAASPWREHAVTPVLRRLQANSGSNTCTAQRPPACVSLYDVALSRIPQPQVLAWLLGSSESSLCILDLQEMPGIAARQTLGIHAPHLRSLRLLHFSLESAAFLRQCTRLEEFVIYTIPIIVPLAPLPLSIEHFSFRNPRHSFRDTLHPILDAIEVLPNLRILTCDKDSAGLRDFETLKAKCTAMGVEVVITGIPSWVYEDPTVVHRFPRRRSVSNFRLMTS